MKLNGTMTVRGISASATIAAASDLLATEFGDELVLLNLRDGVYYGLDGVGTRVWKLVQQPVSVATICDAIVEEYDVARARCQRDVHSLLGELAAKGLIEIREDV